MRPVWTPMRWPSHWSDPSLLQLLQDAGIDYLLVERSRALDLLIPAAAKYGISVDDLGSPPAGIEIVPGVWPGIQLSEGGAIDTVAAGPTGAPWVDSNGWTIRLNKALHPESAVWVEAQPKGLGVRPKSYLMAIADAASRGGRWILSLDDGLAAAIAAQQPDALRAWKSIAAATRFFATHSNWADSIPQATLGVVSDFSGPNEFLSHELLNLLDRTNTQSRILPKAKLSDSSFAGLQAVLYADQDPPAPDLRRRALEFAGQGGLLILGRSWESLPGSSVTGDAHPRYDFRILGKGKLAIAKSEPKDPYLLANDSVSLIGHRHDLLRFWNGGAVASSLTAARDRQHFLLQMLFFSERGVNLQRGGQGEAVSVRVAGKYRAGRLWTFDEPPRPVDLQVETEAVELHLPPMRDYAAVELET